MHIIVKGKNSNTGRYRSKDLTPTQRIESLVERNYQETGDRESDRQNRQNIETVLKEAKSA